MESQPLTNREQLLADYPVFIEIPVAWGDMDAFQHVNNVVYFRWFESGRIAYFERLESMDYMREHGVGPILASARCRFRLPLTYPDTVSVAVRVPAIEASDRFSMEYAVISHQHDRIAAEGSGLIVTYDYRQNQKTDLPEVWRQRIAALEGWDVASGQP